MRLPLCLKMHEDYVQILDLKTRSMWVVRFMIQLLYPQETSSCADPIAILDTAAQYTKITAIKRHETTAVQTIANSFTMSAISAHFNTFQRWKTLYVLDYNEVPSLDSEHYTKSWQKNECIFLNSCILVGSI